MKKRRITANQLYIFSRSHTLRFEWLALLAYKRKTESVGQGYTSIAEILRLPSWRERHLKQAETNVGRYIQSLTKSGFALVESERPWHGGPYRLRMPPTSIAFDLPLESVRRALGLRKPRKRTSLEKLRAFTIGLAKANSYIFRGILLNPGRLESASYEFANLADAASDFPRSWRIIALLGAARVQDRLGNFLSTQRTLADCALLFRGLDDPILKANFHLAQSWSLRRAGKYDLAKREAEIASDLMGKGADRATIAGVIEREGLALMDIGDHVGAAYTIAEALEYRLLTNDYDRIGGSCFNIGNALHRTNDTTYLTQAKDWLELSIKICGWMHLGRDNATAEIMLGKTLLELGDRSGCEKWLRKARVIVENTHSKIDESVLHVVRAQYFNEVSQKKRAIEELRAARRVYSKLKRYPVKRTDQRLSIKYPDLWRLVVAAE